MSPLIKALSHDLVIMGILQLSDNTDLQSIHCHGRKVVGILFVPGKPSMNYKIIL